MKYDFSKYSNEELNDFALEIDLCDNPEALQKAFDEQTDGSEMIGDFSAAAESELRARANRAQRENEDPSERLRGSLNVAARARQQFGASQSQVDYIVSLATELDICDRLENIQTLTKGEASSLITDLQDQINEKN